MVVSSNSKIAIAAVFVMLLSACIGFGSNLDAAEDAYPASGVTYETKTGDGMVTQTITEMPERIIAGNVQCLEILLYFGLGDRVVGVFYLEDEIWEGVADEYKKLQERIGSEYILTGLMSQAVATSLEPDLIFGYASSVGSSKWAVGTLDYWNNQGCHFLSMKTQSNERNAQGLVNDYNLLGEIFQIQDKTGKFIDDFNAAAESVKGAGVKTAILEYSGDKTTYAVYGDDSFIGDMLTTCKGVNSFADGKSIDKASLVAAIDTEAMILIAFGDNTPEKALNDLYNDSALKDVPAVKNKKVIALGLSQTYGGVQAPLVMQKIADLMNDASGSGGSDEPSKDSSGSMTVIGAIIVVIVVIAIAAYFVMSKKKNGA